MTEINVNFKSTVRQRVSTELREFFVLSGYLYVCFTALAYFKASILHTHGIDFAPWAFAAIKAAVSAKFMLIGRAFHLAEGYEKRPLIIPTLYKSFAFLVLVAILTAIEGVVAGYFHGRSTMESLREFGDGSVHQVIATMIILLLIFIPYFAFRSLGDIVGDKVLVRLYFERRQ